MTRLLTITAVALSTLGLLILTATAQNSILRPTASEVFQLRSECARLGHKILDVAIVGPALSKSAVSHYNPRTNRCYVELNVQTADTTKPLPYLSRYLHDGQTGEILAVAQVKNGEKWGMVYDQSHLPKIDIAINAGWDDANQYINAMMADDRKQ